MKDIKQKFVNISTIPEKQTKKGAEWRQLFEAIPPQKAWTPEPEKFKLQTLRNALKSLQDKKLLLNIEVQTRTINDKIVVFVANNAKEETESVERPTD